MPLKVRDVFNCALDGFKGKRCEAVLQSQKDALCKEAVTYTGYGGTTEEKRCLSGEWEWGVGLCHSRNQIFNL